jgi:hypothetical protein
MDILRFVRPDLHGTKYHGVESLESISLETGIPVENLVKVRAHTWAVPLITQLNANENVYGAPPQVAEAILKAEHHIYPDPAQLKLRAALAKYHGVGMESVVAGSGSDDLLDVLIRVVGPKAIVISTPTFGMYRLVARYSPAPPSVTAQLPRQAGRIQCCGCAPLARFPRGRAGRVRGGARTQGRCCNGALLCYWLIACYECLCRWYPFEHFVA